MGNLVDNSDYFIRIELHIQIFFIFLSTESFLETQLHFSNKYDFILI